MFAKKFHFVHICNTVIVFSQNRKQERMIRSMQLHYILIERFIFRLNFPGMRLHGSAKTNPRKQIDAIASLDGTAFLSQKEKVY